MLPHDKVNFSLHRFIVESRALFILQALPFLGGFLIVAPLGYLDRIKRRSIV